MRLHEIVKGRAHIEIPQEVREAYPRLFSMMMRNGHRDAFRTIADSSRERIARARVADATKPHIEFDILERPRYLDDDLTPASIPVCGFYPCEDKDPYALFEATKEYLSDHCASDDQIPSYEFMLAAIDLTHLVESASSAHADVSFALDVTRAEDATIRSAIEQLPTSREYPTGVLLKKCYELEFAAQGVDERLCFGLKAAEHMLRESNGPADLMPIEGLWARDVHKELFANPRFERTLKAAIDEYNAMSGSDEDKQQAARQVINLQRVSLAYDTSEF